MQAKSQLSQPAGGGGISSGSNAKAPGLHGEQKLVKPALGSSLANIRGTADM